MKSANIPWDLETTPLQIKTNSTPGSWNNKIYAVMLDKNGTLIGSVQVKFSSPMKYLIGNCMSGWEALPVQPPVEVDKVWTITKTEIAWKITCNNVEVLNYLFAASKDSDCVPQWGGDVVEQIKFNNADSASDFYRAGKGLHFILLLQL